MPDGFIETPNCIKILLRYNPENGSFNVEGPINDKILCYGLLELARETVYNYHHPAATGKGSGITIPLRIPRV